MIAEPKPIVTDLTVIGAGLAGLAAALFAADRGIPTAVVGPSAHLALSSGLIDLLGVHPMADGTTWDNPWAGLKALTRDLPEHPYGLLSEADIRAALDAMFSFLAEAGLPYERGLERNSKIITSLGTIRPAYGLPRTMWAGALALAEQRPGLIVGFQGMKDFSPAQVVANAGQAWPGLQAARVAWPDERISGELIPGELTSAALELPANREKLARAVRPLLGRAEVVGFPAVLGVNGTAAVMSELEKLIGRPVFEIPTWLHSAPGLRLVNALESGLRRPGVSRFSPHRVSRVDRGPAGQFALTIRAGEAGRTILSRAVILASGRFMGQGLIADRRGIREAVFDLPVAQPGDRAKWHAEDFFDPAGNPINRAGLRVDDRFRPLGRDNRPAWPSLFAAGSILAHQDWVRMKCGAGLAVATAWAAVRSAQDSLGWAKSQPRCLSTG